MTTDAQRARWRAYYAKNRKRILQRQHGYWYANPDKSRARAMRTYWKHRKKKLARMRAYLATRREWHREYNRLYNKLNSQRLLEYQRQRRHGERLKHDWRELANRNRELLTQLKRDERDRAREEAKAAWLCEGCGSASTRSPTGLCQRCRRTKCRRCHRAMLRQYAGQRVHDRCLRED